MSSLFEVTSSEYGKYVRWLENQIHSRSYMWPAIFVGSRISSAIGDIIRQKTQEDAINSVAAAKNVWRSEGLGLVQKFAKLGPLGNAADLVEEIYAQHETLDPLLVAGVLAGLGGTLENYAESFMATGQLHYAYKTLMYHTVITPRMRRYWNKYGRPNWPAFSQAYEYYRRSRLWGQYKLSFSEDDMKESARMDGWPDDQLPNLTKSMAPLPSVREAFYLWIKDAISRDQRNAIWFAQGWPDDFYDQMEENFWYNPSLYDLTRIADSVGLPQTWAIKKMKRIGLNTEDQAIMWRMLKMRPIRDELRNITGVWTWRFKFGRCTLVELDNALGELEAEYEIHSTEIALLKEKAALDYEDELITEWIEVLTWRFRSALITETEFLEGLENLGISHEKANLMVEIEKAKGYLGGY